MTETTGQALLDANPDEPRRLFFSVGEPSGDLHGANLIRSLRRRHPRLECVGYGGPEMVTAGFQSHFDLTTLAVMWIAQVFTHIAKFWRLYKQADRYFATEQVDGVVLIDYPGFNWWIARAAKRHGIPVFYYGVPQLWAWAPWRVRKMRRLVDLALCKLPFEPEWFQSRGVSAVDVGHPFFDEMARQTVDEAFIEDRQDDERPWVVLLPGSRNQEIAKNLETLIESAREIVARVPKARFAISCLKDSQADACRDQLESLGGPAMEVHAGRTPEWIRLASCCVACSGSVSLELLYHRKPTVIVYRLSPWAKLAARVMLRVRYVTLVNLLATRQIERRDWSLQDPDAVGAEEVPFPEYVTTSNPAAKVANRVANWLTDNNSRERVEAQLDDLRDRYVALGASDRGAAAILDWLRQRGVMTRATPSVARAA